MPTKNIIPFQRSFDLASAIPFRICVKILTYQLAIFLVNSSFLGIYYISSSTTNSYSLTVEETIHQGIPSGRISGASR